MSLAPSFSTSVPIDARAFLIVRALDQTFALPVEFVRSAFKIEAVTRVPMAPPYLLGLANLRGAIVGIVCLARRLDPNARAFGPGALALAIESGGETFALAVEEIGDIVHARAEDIAPTPIHVELKHAALMAGILKSGSLLAPILDPEGVFDLRQQCDVA